MAFANPSTSHFGAKMGQEWGKKGEKMGLPEAQLDPNRAAN